MSLRLAGEGEAGPEGGRPGDLFVQLRVRPHERLRREGTHVLSDVEVSISRAVLGGSVKVATLDGEQDVELEPGTWHGSVLRIPGKGVPALEGGGRGDHLATVQVRLPRRLSPEQRQLFEQLAELEGEDPANRGLFDRVKDIFG